MGRPSKLTDAQWEELQHHDWRSLAQQFMDSKNDEACIALMLRLHCMGGQARKLFRSAAIERYRFEFSVKGGRIDLLLFHSDGGLSIVEVKGQNCVRDVVGGIGQLFLYEAGIRSIFRDAPYVRKYLVSPLSGVDAKNVDLACSLAGVEFIAYAPFALINAERERCQKEWVEHA